jgi:hypothetical protein
MSHKIIKFNKDMSYIIPVEQQNTDQCYFLIVKQSQGSLFYDISAWSLTWLLMLTSNSLTAAGQNTNQL